MNRSLQIAVALTLAASPVFAQRGGGGARGGGGTRGGGGGFHEGAPAYHSGGSAPHYAPAPRYAPAPSYSGMRIDSTGSHPVAPPVNGYRGSYVPGNRGGYAPGTGTARPPYVGHRPPHYGPPNYYPGGRRPHRPYYPPFLGSYGYGSAWLGASVLPGFPLYGYPSYSPLDDYDYNFLDDYSYTEPYDDGSYYGYDTPAPPYADPNDYSSGYDNYPQQPQEQTNAYIAPAAPAIAPEPPLPITLIFKDGRPPVEIRNYIATDTSIRIFDSQRRVEIPIADLDLDATFKANYQAGVDFHLPTATGR